MTPAPEPAPRIDPPPRLDAVESVFQTAAMSLRRGFRGRRFVFAIVVVLVLPLLVSFPASLRSHPGRHEALFYQLLALYHFGIAVPGVALAFATAFPWPEAEEGTLTWWFTSPVRRWTVHLGRFLAAWVVGTVVLPLSIAAITLPLDLPEAAEAGGVARSAVGATLLAYPAYLAIFWLLATWFRRGLATCVFYVLAENTLSFIQTNAVRLTMIHNVRGVMRPAVPMTSSSRSQILLPTAEVPSPAVAVVTFAAVTVVALVLSLLLVEWIEYRGKTSQAS